MALTARDYVDFIRDGNPRTLNGESPDDFFWRCSISNFSYAETLRLRRAKLVAPDPPDGWLPRIVPALWFAEALRARLSERCGVTIPIVLGNGFRPSPRHEDLRGYPDLNKRVGGAKRSTHITYRALDLDPSKRASIEAVREEAARVFNAIKDDCVVGMGFYRWSRRVHIDIGREPAKGWGERTRDALWGRSRQYTTKMRSK